MEIAGLWEAPFPIHEETRIATYGSCFAQHFSRALLSRGYVWLNTEPAPAGVTEAAARDFNYGIFSSRTGNIYTTSLFRQWVEWALEITPVPTEYWVKDGRIYDPFRPTIEPEGFGSVEEMEKSRRYCIAAFRESILSCNLLVFTLGLTESWWNAQGNYEYPLCPGTHAGQFDPGNHAFVNQDYDLVRGNLVKAITLIRQHRKRGPKVLLTVSPVPLTATNSGQHVLVATTESKAILRAVAGHAAANMKGVSYFPSYEIISSPVFRGAFFEPNLRNVTPEGVAHVMACFFAGLGAQEADEAEAPAVTQAVSDGVGTARTPDDVKCDEEMLAVFGNRP